MARPPMGTVACREEGTTASCVAKRAPRAACALFRCGIPVGPGRLVAGIVLGPGRFASGLDEDLDDAGFVGAPEGVVGVAQADSLRDEGAHVDRVEPTATARGRAPSLKNPTPSL